MKIKCISNSTSVFGKNELPFGISFESEFSEVNPNKEYFVYGMLYEKNFLFYYLCIDDLFYFIPSQFFEILDNSIPSNWYFKFAEGEEKEAFEAIWGYYELCFDEKHYDELVAGEGKSKEKEIEVFKKRAKEMYGDID